MAVVASRQWEIPFPSRLVRYRPPGGVLWCALTLLILVRWVTNTFTFALRLFAAGGVAPPPVGPTTACRTRLANDENALPQRQSYLRPTTLAGPCRAAGEGIVEVDNLHPYFQSRSAAPRVAQSGDVVADWIDGWAASRASIDIFHDVTGRMLGLIYDGHRQTAFGKIGRGHTRSEGVAPPRQIVHAIETGHRKGSLVRSSISRVGR